MVSRRGEATAAEGSTAVWVAAALVGGAVLAGCSPAPAPAPDASASGGAAAAVVTVTVPEADSTGDEHDGASGLASWGGPPQWVALPTSTAGVVETIMGWTPQEDPTSAEVVEQIRARQEQIQTCMADLGLPYWPQIPDQDQVIITEASHVPEQGSAEYAARFGYGAWTEPVHLIDVGVDAASQRSRTEQEYFESLSTTERNTYLRELYGTDPATGQLTTGCYQRSEATPLENVRLLQVQADAATFLAGLADQPEFDALDAEWSQCMARAGFTETSPSRARNRFLALQYASAISPTIAVPWSSAAHELIADDERTVAQADYGCRESTRYPDRFAAIAAPLQRAYLDEHRSDLEDLALALGTTTG